MERQFYVFIDIQFVDQVEALEDESDVALAEQGTLFFFQPADLFVQQVIFACGGVVQ